LKLEKRRERRRELRVKVNGLRESELNFQDRKYDKEREMKIEEAPKKNYHIVISKSCTVPKRTTKSINTMIV